MEEKFGISACVHNDRIFRENTVVKVVSLDLPRVKVYGVCPRGRHVSKWMDVERLSQPCLISVQKSFNEIEMSRCRASDRATAEKEILEIAGWIDAH